MEINFQKIWVRMQKILLTEIKFHLHFYDSLFCGSALLFWCQEADFCNCACFKNERLGPFHLQFCKALRRCKLRFIALKPAKIFTYMAQISLANILDSSTFPCLNKCKPFEKSFQFNNLQEKFNQTLNLITMPWFYAHLSTKFYKISA